MKKNFRKLKGTKGTALKDATNQKRPSISAGTSPKNEATDQPIILSSPQIKLNCGPKKRAENEISRQVDLSFEPDVDENAKIEQKVKQFMNDLMSDPVFVKCVQCGTQPCEIVKAARYLYSNGYLNEQLELLGAGSYNFVFRIKNTKRVVKYCKSASGDTNGVSADEMSLRELEGMIKGINDEKLKKWAGKYLPKIKRINDKDIYEDELAVTDLADAFNPFKRPLNTNKTLDSILRLSKRMAKGIKVLHDKGYVHLDIKPANMLKVDNSKYDEAAKLADIGQVLKDKNGKTYTVIKRTEVDNGKSIVRYYKKYEETGEETKITKHTVNVADFGGMRSIRELMTKKTVQPFGTPGFMASDACSQLPNSADDVKKWDIYALGITFYYLLFKTMPRGNGGSPLAYSFEYPPVWGDESYLKSLKHSYWAAFQMFAPAEEKRIFYYLKLIDLMTLDSPHRILIDEVLEKIKCIEKMKKK